MSSEEYNKIQKKLLDQLSTYNAKDWKILFEGWKKLSEGVEYEMKASYAKHYIQQASYWKNNAYDFVTSDYDFVIIDELKGLEKSNNKEDNSLNKNIAISDEIILDALREYISMGHPTMTGYDYIHSNTASYKHLRLMLIAVWAIQHKHPNQCFDIDQRFGYNVPAIRDYLKDSASASEINMAHDSVRQEYRSRGRPKGARNKSYTQRTTKTGVSIDDILTNENLTDDTNADAGAKRQEFTNSGQMLDVSEFVTHNYLDDCNYIDGSKLLSVVGELQSAIDAEHSKISAKIDAITLSKPTVVEIKRTELPNISLGVQHRHFPDLLAMCMAAMRGGQRLNVWVYGPAGTGKTTAARYCAEALGIPFYMLGALETGFQVLGYNDAHGNYVTTLFRQCWEFGGAIALDEIDSYSPSAALALNGALANGHCAFPDKIVPRHPNCIIIAGANTTGLGGTIEYVGRMKQDAAFLDRFVMLDWPIDEALEDALCANKYWLAVVRKARQNVIRQQMKGAMITPRATLYGEALIAAGVNINRVVNSTLKKGMTDAQWKQVKPGDDLILAAAVV